MRFIGTFCTLMYASSQGNALSYLLYYPGTTSKVLFLLQKLESSYWIFHSASNNKIYSINFHCNVNHFYKCEKHIKIKKKRVDIEKSSINVGFKYFIYRTQNDIAFDYPYCHYLLLNLYNRLKRHLCISISLQFRTRFPWYFQAQNSKRVKCIIKLDLDITTTANQKNYEWGVEGCSSKHDQTLFDLSFQFSI